MATTVEKLTESQKDRLLELLLILFRKRGVVDAVRRLLMKYIYPHRRRDKTFKIKAEFPNATFVAHFLIAYVFERPKPENQTWLLSHFVRESLRSRQVDANVRVAFKSALKALKDGEWEEFHDHEQTLQTLAQDHPQEELLEEHHALLMLGSGDYERILAILPQEEPLADIESPGLDGERETPTSGTTEATEECDEADQASVETNAELTPQEHTPMEVEAAVPTTAEKNPATPVSAVIQGPCVSSAPEDTEAIEAADQPRPLPQVPPTRDREQNLSTDALAEPWRGLLEALEVAIRELEGELRSLEAQPDGSMPWKKIWKPAVEGAMRHLETATSGGAAAARLRILADDAKAAAEKIDRELIARKQAIEHAETLRARHCPGTDCAGLRQKLAVLAQGMSRLEPPDSLRDLPSFVGPWKESGLLSVLDKVEQTIAELEAEAEAKAARLQEIRKLEQQLALLRGPVPGQANTIAPAKMPAEPPPAEVTSKTLARGIGFPQGVDLKASTSRTSIPLWMRDRLRGSKTRRRPSSYH